VSTTAQRLPFPVALFPAAHAVGDTLRRAARAVWAALEAQGQARARRELLSIASRLESSRPDMAARIRRAAAR
jgi:hypothetical protein